MQGISIPQHIATTSFDESTIILDLKKNTYYALNESAAEFWKFLTQSGSIENATEEMLKLYEKSSTTIEGDIEKLVDSLIQLGLLNAV